MKSSVYISTEKIEVVGYAGSTIKRYVTYPLAEGTMINGMITDAVFLTECLTIMRKENPDLFTAPSLIVDGSAILSRKLVAPRLSDKRYRQMVRDDLADTTDDPDSLVCGYRKLGTEGNHESLLACAVDKGRVDAYISAFKEAGIKLSAIRVGTEALLRYISSRKELASASFVLNLIDGPTMLSMTFENGSNVFMSRSRLYGETKEQIFQNVMENLNGMIQFNRSQKFTEIAQVYYLGVSEADLRLIEALNPYAGINMRMLDLSRQTGGKIPPEAHFSYLNTLMGSDSIDLIAGRKLLDVHIKHKKPRKVWPLAMVLYILVLALPIGYAWKQDYDITEKINGINAYLSDPEVKEVQDEMARRRIEQGRYQSVIDQHEEMLAWKNSMTTVSSQMLDVLLFKHGHLAVVTQFSYSENPNTVQMSAVSASAYAANDYVDALRGETDIVQSVVYTGGSPDGSGGFSFPLTIRLAERPAVTEGGAE
jgi:hypothetical protein